MNYSVCALNILSIEHLPIFCEDHGIGLVIEDGKITNVTEESYNE